MTFLAKDEDHFTILYHFLLFFLVQEAVTRVSFEELSTDMVANSILHLVSASNASYSSLGRQSLDEVALQLSFNTGKVGCASQFKRGHYSLLSFFKKRHMYMLFAKMHFNFIPQNALTFPFILVFFSFSIRNFSSLYSKLDFEDFDTFLWIHT